MSSFYEILGVGRDASGEDVRRAFRRAAMRLHPDRESGAQDEMVRLNEAYDTLKDAGRRAAYDASLRPAGYRLPARAPHGGVPVGYDPLAFKLRIFLPLDAAVTRALHALDAAVEDLAYDLYDDHYVARFAEAVETAAEALAQAHQRLFSAPWPDALSAALNRYRQALAQADDAIEDFRGFTENFDSDLIVEGRDLLRWSQRMGEEAREALGVG